MHCLFCGANKDQLKVIDSRSAESGEAIRRRRECLGCGKRFTTYERVELGVRLTVVKKDGRRMPWDRTKIVTGLERACYKRPVPEEQLLKVAEDVEEEAQRNFEREVPSEWIGGRVMAKLRQLDEVAYIRFASVYRDFRTVDELMRELRQAVDLRRLEDPDQQELFTPPARAEGGRSRPEVRAEGSNGTRRRRTGRSAGGGREAATGPEVPAGEG